ncbi:U-box domain-containing protein 34, partial [Bienertia sinuspersici]
LGKLRHPHLVTLVGSCPEAGSVVYDYVSNGSLQWHLLQKCTLHLCHGRPELELFLRFQLLFSSFILLKLKR